MSKQEKTWSFKEIDTARGTIKGTAFRAFKELREGFDEGRDYFYLNGEQDQAEIESLRAKARIYASSVNAVLLSESGYAAVMDYLDN